MNSFRLPLVVLLGSPVFLALPGSASAQTASRPKVVAREHVLAGGGVQSVSNRDVGRSDFAFGEIAVRHARIGAGVEYANLGSFRTVTGLAIATFDRTARDRAVFATVTWRVFEMRRLSVDVCGGAGVDKQRETLTTTPRPQVGLPPTPPTTTATTLNAAILVLGVDAPVRIFRFLSVVPRVRVYDAPGLRSRGKESGETSWLAAGIGIRGHW